MFPFFIEIKFLKYFIEKKLIINMNEKQDDNLGKALRNKIVKIICNFFL
jgi:hypothetical protein